MKKIRGAYASYLLMYFFYYGGAALFSGLIAVYLFDKGFSATQTGIVISCAYLATIAFQLLLGRLGDRFNKRLVSALALIVAAVGGCFFPLQNKLLWITVVYSFIYALLYGCNPALESFATTSRFRYYSVRIWGAIGYAVFYYACGLLYQFFPPQVIYLLFSVCILLCTFGLWNTEDAVAPAAAAAPSRPSGNVLRRIFSREFVLYLLLSALFWGSLLVHDTYAPAVLTDNGLAVGQMSLIIGLSTMMQVPAIYFSTALINRLSNNFLLCAEFGVLVLQFLVFAVPTGLPVQILAIILAKGTISMLFIMVNMKVVATLVPQADQLTALSITAAVKSLAMVLCQQFSGVLIDHYSYSVFYGFLLAFAVLGLVLSLCCRIPDGKDVALYR